MKVVNTMKTTLWISTLRMSCSHLCGIMISWKWDIKIKHIDQVVRYISNGRIECTDSTVRALPWICSTWHATRQYLVHTNQLFAYFTHHTWWTRKTTLAWDSELTEQCAPNYIGNFSEKVIKFVMEKSQGWQVHITLGFIHFFFTQPLLNRMDPKMRIELVHWTLPLVHC